MTAGTEASPGPPSSEIAPAGVSAPAGRGRGRAVTAWAARTGRATGWGLLGGAVFVAAWSLAAGTSPDVPTPAESLEAAKTLLSDPFYDAGPNDKGIGRHLVISLGRVFTGFGLAALVGIPLGLLLGTSRAAWQAVNPIVQLLRPVSPLAWFPIWLAILKSAPDAAVIVIFITALWPTLINTAAGAADIPRDQRNVARVFRFGRVAYVRHVLLPNAFPSAVTGLRLSMGIAWMVIVAVEMLSGGSGVGAFVWESYNTGNLPNVVAAIGVIGVVGLVLDTLLMRLAGRAAIQEIQA
ncbi:nitrate ABC transporter permease [Thermomonospora umbrina]|uniref:Nitrate/nitrite transport system permease protein n=1 Tax=Thermomonospora umbrina TaxID=111806 RepID=A0A3D9SY00_9ACTN|nr:nitrate ABC transporter permease [Thermomonospora umbrina]REE97875.1 nitrate/nitrite transport system permease protein [Thermomonospora umbrina]